MITLKRTHRGSRALRALFGGGLLIAALQGGIAATGPFFDWAAPSGGSSTDAGNAVALGSDGSVHVAGFFSGSMNIGGVVLNSSGSEDLFVAKYDAAGNLLWAQREGGSGRERGYDIAVDAAGNVYVGGFSTAGASFGGVSLPARGGADLLLLKYGPSGNLLWARRDGGSNEDSVRSVAVDFGGNVFTTGSIVGAAAIGSHSLTSAGDEDVFVAKFDAAGVALWAVRAGGGSRDRAWGIAVDRAGQSFITGHFSGASRFGPDVISGNGDLDQFTAKLDPSGAFLWARSFGGSGTDFGRDIAVGPMGEPVVAGLFSGPANGSGVAITGNGGFDALLARYDANGNLLWAFSAGGSGADQGRAIAIDANEIAYFGASMVGPLTVGTQAVAGFGGDDIVVFAVDSNGAALWAKDAGGPGGDLPFGLDASSDGREVLVTGALDGTTWFDQFVATPGTGRDAFVAKLITRVNQPPVADAGQDLTAAAGAGCIAAIQLDGSASFDPDGDSLNYVWTGAFGVVMGEAPTVVLPLGIHAIELTAGDGEFVSTDTVIVEVVDATAPEITELTASPAVLWPPNHKMADVALSGSVTDNCAGAVSCAILSVASNEPSNGAGDGNTTGDWEVTGDLTLRLRAERSGGGAGRVYTVVVECMDASGNSSVRSVEITVPHSKGE